MKQEIIVDDYLPAIDYKDQAIQRFAKCKSNEFWVCILEKAFAKAAGNYNKLEAGTGMEAC